MMFYFEEQGSIKLKDFGGFDNAFVRTLKKPLFIAQGFVSLNSNTPHTRKEKQETMTSCRNAQYHSTILTEVTIYHLLIKGNSK